jgi:hypothetical protein
LTLRLAVPAFQSGGAPAEIFGDMQPGIIQESIPPENYQKVLISLSLAVRCPMVTLGGFSGDLIGVLSVLVPSVVPKMVLVREDRYSWIYFEGVLQIRSVGSEKVRPPISSEKLA